MADIIALGPRTDRPELTTRIALASVLTATMDDAGRRHLFTAVLGATGVTAAIDEQIVVPFPRPRQAFSDSSDDPDAA